MRVLKFRAWNKQEKRFLTQDEMTCIGGYYYTFGVDTAENHELCQFTGLFDKSGKEICEGDIIRCYDSNEEHSAFNTEVWFHEGKFLTRHYGFPVSSWSGRTQSWCEIIGNIYSGLQKRKEREESLK